MKKFLVSVFVFLAVALVGLVFKMDSFATSFSNKKTSLKNDVSLKMVGCNGNKINDNLYSECGYGRYKSADLDDPRITYKFNLVCSGSFKKCEDNTDLVAKVVSSNGDEVLNEEFKGHRVKIGRNNPVISKIVNDGLNAPKNQFLFYIMTNDIPEDVSDDCAIKIYNGDDVVATATNFGKVLKLRRK